jgi:PPOX class probable F420-dependent enzyme
MRTMTPDEARHFLLEAPRTGKLAVTHADGRPHVSPIWYDLDGDNVVFTTWHTSVKARSIERDPHVCLCVDDEKPPYSYVIVEGRAAFVTVTAEERLYWATRIATRYMGDELGVTFGKRNGVEGEHIVRMTPTNIVAHTGITD